MKPMTLKELMTSCMEITGIRYNGGWTKIVTGIDKTKTNGYSILGEFFKHNIPRYWKDGELILDCDVQGSRKHPRKEYRLMKFQDEKLIVVAEAEDTTSWAVNLWDAIESQLKTSEPETEVEIPVDNENEYVLRTALDALAAAIRLVVAREDITDPTRKQMRTEQLMNLSHNALYAMLKETNSKKRMETLQRDYRSSEGEA